MTKLAFGLLCRLHSHHRTFTLSLLPAILLSLISFPAAHAQTFTLIHYFTGRDGAYPMAGLTWDQAGNLYGTTMEGGDVQACPQPGGGCGTVFKLSKHGASWTLTPLFLFNGYSAGAWPFARVTFGPDGALYGTTAGVYQVDQCPPHCGTVFRLTPPARNCAASHCSWTQKVLYEFDGQVGGKPRGPVTFDSAGNLYSTTSQGGAGCGIVFQMTRSGGQWTFATLYDFLDGQDGCLPYSGVVIDHAGNLYGTATQAGLPGFNWGTVYALSPSDAGWIETTLYQFQNQADGFGPYGGLIFDTAGNLVGTTASGGSDLYGGTVFELTPGGANWNYNFAFNLPSLGIQGSGGPSDTLLQDAAGNLYGTTFSEGTHGYGSVFKLTPSNGNWIYTDLYDFTGGSDGAHPAGGVVMDAAGNLFGTTSAAGGPGKGTIFEITP
jgi:uncharacterized repeat protein (TIGR03803 family)